MCGIAGIVAPHAGRFGSTVAKMLEVLAHRGPDGRGILEFPNCILGHVRLSIVDIEGGAQPMRSPLSMSAVTFNGEIYGFLDLRRGLPDYPFGTQSDTEVLLALYDRYAEQMLGKLPGMFAFALWDDAQQALFCARDRFGEKPLYYAFGRNGEFIFASEMKAILATGLLEPELDREELAHYLQYLYVRPDRTIYRNVHCLPPGHKIVVRDGKARVERYWDLPAPSPLVSQPEAVVEFRRLLESAIQKQLIADVPVAAFLSGGLDSTTITAFASRRHPGLRTISFGFEGQLSELPFARDAAKRFGTDHVEIEENRVDVGDLLLEMARVYDEPFADSSNIPTYLISKAAREFAKVVLTGDGGDELLAGYSYWYGPIADMRLAEGTSAAVRTLLRVSSALCRRLHLPFPARLMRLERGARYRKQHGSAERAHRAQQQFFSDQELRALGLKPVIDGLWPEIEASDDVDWAMRADLRRYLPGDILVKTDRASMAHGLELRAPFLDVDLATFCISLPSCLKLNQGVDKYLLREACGGEWPDSIGRRSKQGFGAPVGQWLARPDVSELMHEYLERRDRVIYTLLPYDECRGLRRSRDYRAWSLLVLSIWLETHRCSMPLADQALR